MTEVGGISLPSVLESHKFDTYRGKVSECVARIHEEISVASMVDSDFVEASSWTGFGSDYWHSSP